MSRTDGACDEWLWRMIASRNVLVVFVAISSVVGCRDNGGQSGRFAVAPAAPAATTSDVHEFALHDVAPDGTLIVKFSTTVTESLPSGSIQFTPNGIHIGANVARDPGGNGGQTCQAVAAFYSASGEPSEHSRVSSDRMLGVTVDADGHTVHVAGNVDVPKSPGDYVLRVDLIRSVQALGGGIDTEVPGRETERNVEGTPVSFSRAPLGVAHFSVGERKE